MGQRLQRLGCVSLVCTGWLLAPSRFRSDAGVKPTILLRVSEGDTGKPVGGVAISTRTEKATARAQTDDQGRCSLEISEPSPTYFSILARKDGFVPISVDWSARGGGKPTIPAELSVPLENGTTIGGLI